MSTEQSKLRRSNIHHHSITLNGSHQLNETSDQFHQLLLETSSKKFDQQEQKMMKAKEIPSTSYDSKQTLPFLNLKEISNMSFISIDDAYLSPKFNKTRQPKDHMILNKNLTELQSDTESIGGKSVRTYQGQDQYHKYWKSKAHQYLDENFKLRQENRKLKSQLESLQKTTRIHQTGQSKTSIKDQSIKKNQKSYLYLQSLFKNKLEELEDELKEKNLKITTLEDKLLEMNRKLLGEQERTQLIQRLGSQIEMLSQQNIFLKKQVYQYEQKANNSKEIQAKTINPYAKYKSKEKPNFCTNRRSTEIIYDKNRN